MMSSASASDLLNRPAWCRAAISSLLYIGLSAELSSQFSSSMPVTLFFFAQQWRSLFFRKDLYMHCIIYAVARNLIARKLKGNEGPCYLRALIIFVCNEWISLLGSIPSSCCRKRRNVSSLCMAFVVLPCLT